MASESSNSVCLSFRCDPVTHINLVLMAEREGIALATLCTRLIKQAVKRNGQASHSSEHMSGIRSRARRRLAGRSNLLVVVSVDHLEPEVHDRLRGMKGSHGRALDTLGMLRRHGIQREVSTVVTRERIHSGEFERFLVEMRRLGVARFGINLHTAVQIVTEVTALASSPTGSILAIGDGQGTIKLWDLTSRKPLPPSLLGHTGKITALLGDLSRITR